MTGIAANLRYPMISKEASNIKPITFFKFNFNSRNMSLKYSIEYLCFWQLIGSGNRIGYTKLKQVYCFNEINIEYVKTKNTTRTFSGVFWYTEKNRFGYDFRAHSVDYKSVKKWKFEKRLCFLLHFQFLTGVNSIWR